MQYLFFMGITTSFALLGEYNAKVEYLSSVINDDTITTEQLLVAKVLLAECYVSRTNLNSDLDKAVEIYLTLLQDPHVPTALQQQIKLRYALVLGGYYKKPFCDQVAECIDYSKSIKILKEIIDDPAFDDETHDTVKSFLAGLLGGLSGDKQKYDTTLATELYTQVIKRGKSQEIPAALFGLAEILLDAQPSELILTPSQLENGTSAIIDLYQDAINIDSTIDKEALEIMSTCRLIQLYFWGHETIRSSEKGIALCNEVIDSSISEPHLAEQAEKFMADFLAKKDQPQSIQLPENY